MSISYLSKPLSSDVTPFRENIDLISKVAQYRQSKYDKVVDTMLQKQNDLLNLDTSKGSFEATDRKNNMLKIADDQLNQLAKVDLLNPENIAKADSIFEPILNDKDIMAAASITSFVNKQSNYFEEWKKEGKGLYDSKNEAFFWEKVQKNTQMSLKDTKEKGYYQPVATEFVDIDKWYRDAVKEISPDITVTTAPDGEGRIFKIKNKVVPESKILQMLPTNAKIIAQAEINAHYNYAGTKKDELLAVQQNAIIREQKSVKDSMDENSKQVGYLQEQIKSIKANDADGIALVNHSGYTKEQLIEQLQAKIKSYNEANSSLDLEYKTYETNLQDFNKTYGFNQGKFEKDLSEDQLSNLKTSVWLANRKQQFASAMSYQERDVDITYDEIQRDFIKQQYAIDLKTLDHQYQMIEDAAKDARDPNKIKLDEFGNPIIDYSSAYSDTPANDQTSDVSKPKEGEEYETLTKKFGDYRKGLKTLETEYIDKKRQENTSYNEDSFKKELAEYNKIVSIWDKNPDLKLEDTIPNSDQTFKQFFDANSKLKQFLTIKEGMKSIDDSHQILLSKIEKTTEDKTYADLRFKPQAKDIEVAYAKRTPDPTNIKSDYKIEYDRIIIPASVSENYLKGTLTSKDYDKIWKANNFNWGEEEYMKKLVREGKPTDNNYAKYKTTFEKHLDEAAREIQSGYLLPGVYLKDITTDKSPGKLINNNAIQYINTLTNENYKKGDIGIKYFYRDPESPSGWKVKFSVTTTKENNEKVVTPYDEKLTPTFVRNSGLNIFGDVSEISKAMELQAKENPKKQEFLYSHLGKFYKFVKTDEGVNVYEKTGDTTFKLLNSNPSSVDQLLRTVIQMREKEFKRQ